MMQLKKKKIVYPSKTTLNLCVREKKSLPLQKTIPLVLVVLVAVGIFGKFAVVNQLDKAEIAQSELSALTAQRDALNESIRSRDALREQYNHYSTSWMNESEQGLLPRTEMLELVETMLMPKCQVRQLSASGNTLSITLADVTLDDTSRFVQALYALDHVSNVAVYTASTKDEDAGTQATVAMVITMAYPEGGSAE